MNREIQTGILLAALLSLPCFTEAAPQPYAQGYSGAILNELEPERRIEPKDEKLDIKTEVPGVAPTHMDISAHIDRVEYICDELDVAAVMKDELASSLNKDMSFDEMQQLGRRVMLRLRQKGYMMAVAYVPAQELDDGTLKIKVAIGRYGDIHIDNTSALIDERMLAFMSGIRPGELIRAQSLEKGMLVLNDMPGIKASASLQRGKRPGTVDLEIKVIDLERQGAYLSYDNYGGVSTGRNRYSLEYHYNNLTGIGDQLSMSGMLTNENMHNYQFSYRVPVSNDGAMLHLTASRMDYELSERFSKYQADGVSATYEAGVSIPLHRSERSSSFFSMNYRHRNIKDFIFNRRLATAKTSDSLQVDLSGYQRGRDSFTYSIGHAFGNLNFDRYYRRPDISGHFQKSLGNFYYIHNFDRNWQLHASMSGQYGWTELDSSEQFYISGANGVRAFPQGESGGRSGILGTLELRRRTGIPGLWATMFLDAGRVVGDDNRNLAGAGIGLVYQRSRDWYAKLDWAAPVGSHYSESQGQDVHGRFWLRVVKQF